MLIIFKFVKIIIHQRNWEEGVKKVLCCFDRYSQVSCTTQNIIEVQLLSGFLQALFQQQVQEQFCVFS